MSGTTPPASEDLRLRTGVIDLGRQRVVSAGRSISLTTRETELLAYLVARAGQPVSREELLEQVWHYRSSNPTRAVDLAVRRLRAKVEPDPKAPVHVLSVHGVGYRFVPAAPDESPRADDPSDDARTNVGPPRTSFVGRDAELTSLRGQLAAGARLVSLVGSAGAGKSRLARRVATAVVDGFRGGAWVVDLVDCRTVDDVCARIAEALGASLPGGDPARVVGDVLAERAVGGLLLVLDTFEQLGDDAARAVGQWIAAAPGLQVVVTSRERLHLDGETVVAVPPLGADDALALLRERARAVRGDAHPDDDAVMRRIVARLDGLPLAIELAASRLRALAPAQLLARLDRRFRVLGDRRSDRPARHVTLRAALDWSWDLLGADEQRALALLSVFAGTFSLEAAEAVLGDDGHAAHDAVRELAEKSLVLIEAADPAHLRYRLLESVRAYAAERLSALGGGDGARARHAAYYLDECERLAAATDGPDGAARLEDLARERANLLQIARDGTVRERARAVLAGLPELAARGPADLIERLVEVALAPGLGDALRARLLAERSLLRRDHGSLDAAREDAGQALEVAGDEAAVRVRALHALGRACMASGALDEATAAHREELSLAERLGRRGDAGRARIRLADVLARQGGEDEARRLLDRALATARRDGDRWTEGHVLSRIARFQLETGGDAGEAVAVASAARELLAAFGDRLGSWGLHRHMGLAYVRRGPVAAAAPWLDEARRLAREMGDRAREADVVGAQALAARELGALEDASVRFDEALALVGGDADPAREAVLLRGLGVVRVLQRRWTEAEACLREALAVAERGGDALEIASGHVTLAGLLVEHARIEEADALIRAALARTPGAHRVEDSQLVGLAALIAARAGDADTARAELDRLRQRDHGRDDDAERYGLIEALIGLMLAREVDDGRAAAVRARETLYASSSTRSHTTWMRRLLQQELAEFLAGRRQSR